MFALAGIVYAKLLPADRSRGSSGCRTGWRSRSACRSSASPSSSSCTRGHFHWEYWWWNTPFVLLIVIFGYLWFYLYAAWVYDAPSAAQALDAPRRLAAIDVLMALVFGVGLGWL